MADSNLVEPTLAHVSGWWFVCTGLQTEQPGDGCEIHADTNTGEYPADWVFTNAAECYCLPCAVRLGLVVEEE